MLAHKAFNRAKGYLAVVGFQANAIEQVFIIMQKTLWRTSLQRDSADDCDK